jgi:hypothetical protein
MMMNDDDVFGARRTTFFANRFNLPGGIRSFCVSDDKSARRCDFLAIFQCLKSARRRLARVKDATRDATSAAPSVSPPRAVL